MTNRIDPASVAGIRPKPDQGRSPAPQGETKTERLEFSDLLQAAQDKRVQFSKHASARLEQRQIALSKEDMDLLSDGISRAEKKGSRESLLLMGDTAFVVNVKNRTVITAVDEEGMKGKTFTNIDSAILISRR